MPVCLQCDKEFPVKIEVDGKVRTIGTRLYCLQCSPFGSRNKCGGKPRAIVLGHDDVECQQCSRCSKTLPVEDFYLKRILKTRERRRHSFCKNCKKIEIKHAHRDLKSRAVILMGNQCADCHRQFPQCVYQFHHLDPKEKDIGIAKIHSWEKMQSELQKCVMICANCHSIRHHATDEP